MECSLARVRMMENQARRRSEGESSGRSGSFRMRPSMCCITCGDCLLLNCCRGIAEHGLGGGATTYIESCSNYCIVHAKAVYFGYGEVFYSSQRF